MSLVRFLAIVRDHDGGPRPSPEALTRLCALAQRMHPVRTADQAAWR